MLLFLACVTPDPEPASDPVDVDPFIATGGPGFRVGSSTPAATVPFGMVKVGPDTRDNSGALSAYHCSGYYYEDNTIVGFSHLHMHGTGVPGYGQLLVMPVEQLPNGTIAPDDYATTFSHAHEAAGPGWYTVTLDNGIEAELSATRHAAHHRYTWPQSGGALILDLAWNLFGSPVAGELHMDPESGAVWGYTWMAGPFVGNGFPLYFYGVVDGGFSRFGSWADSEPVEGQTDASGVAVGGWIAPKDTEAELRMAISMVSWEKAKENLEVELPVQSWEQTVDEAEGAWAPMLSRVRTWGATEEQGKIFSTALYHVLQMPTEFGDADGEYRGFDGQVHPAWDFIYHSDMSLWDTYRTAHPYYNLVYPEKGRDFAVSLLKMSEQGGAFPRWPVAHTEGGSMLGAPADIVLADTWVKGIRGWGMEEAWPRLVDQARGVGSYPYNARPDPSLIQTYGYYPYELVGTSVSWLQELDWADASLANLATSLGEEEEAAFFYNRSLSYKNLYDPEVGFFHARSMDGSFKDNFSEFSWLDEYSEGNAWQYLWLAPQDPVGLAELMGGEEIAKERLEFFMQGLVDEGILAFPQTYYWHGNEPDIHAPFLFALWGDADSSLRWSRWIEENLYHAAPDGLAGNDDGGTMSAWYLFSTMGLYPIAGSDLYVVTAPLFEKVEFDLGGGVFTVARVGEGTHIVAQRLDGVLLDKPLLRHSQLRPGGILEVELR